MRLALHGNMEKIFMRLALHGNMEKIFMRPKESVLGTYLKGCFVFLSMVGVARLKNNHVGRHSSVDSSALTVLWSRVQIPSTPSMLFTFIVKF